MQFILTTGWEEGVAALTKRLVEELAADQQVLWLVTGGSNIPASVQVMASITTKLSHNLTVMLADERFGPVGHADSNWAQLLAAGFNNKAATVLEVLQPGDSFDVARQRYEGLVQQALAEHPAIIAQLGIGPDGHVAGILPGSAASLETGTLVAAYEAGPYQRLTMTFTALRQISADYSLAFGETKRAALEMLHEQDVELAKQPAQILKQLPEAYIYNDQFGEHVDV